ncbi:MAG: hypothetical protein MPJ50_07230 [Pirellulales bacterium]|nr:hypothetical protein [Pirellulales bacterium]
MNSTSPSEFPPADSSANEAGEPSGPGVPQVPVRPQRPPEPTAAQQRGCMSILLASFSGIILLTLFVLLAIPFGGVAPVAIAIVGGVFLIAFLHYITWGWWLGQLIRREDDESDDAEE